MAKKQCNGLRSVTLIMKDKAVKETDSKIKSVETELLLTLDHYPLPELVLAFCAALGNIQRIEFLFLFVVLF